MQPGMMPGMMLRVDEKSIMNFKDAMTLFFPHYFNADLRLPSEYGFDLETLFSFWKIRVQWSDIKYTQAQLDIQDVKFRIKRDASGYHWLYVDLPVMKHWELTAHQSVSTALIPASSQIKLVFNDFDFNFSTYLKRDSKGYLDFKVTAVQIKFGQSYLYHENWFIAFLMH